MQLSNTIAIVAILDNADIEIATLAVARGGEPEIMGELIRECVPPVGADAGMFALRAVAALAGAIGPRSSRKLEMCPTGKRGIGENCLYTLWLDDTGDAQLAINNVGICGGEVYYGPLTSFNARTPEEVH